MSRFIQVQGESMWVNLDRVDGVLVRPELRAVGVPNGEPSLEDLHETTGAYEVMVVFQGQMVPVLTRPSKAEAEAEVMRLIGPLIIS